MSKWLIRTAEEEMNLPPDPEKDGKGSKYSPDQEEILSQLEEIEGMVGVEGGKMEEEMESDLPFEKKVQKELSQILMALAESKPKNEAPMPKEGDGY